MNFVCVVFELGDKMLTLSSMDNLIVPCNLLATRIVQSIYFLNPKFQASSHLLWVYSPVCVGPGWKPRRAVFS